MVKEPVKYSIVIVVVGSFNPTIIQPLWLANKKLIRDDEHKEAKIGVIHNEFTQFSLDWIDFTITPDRFEVKCSAKSYFEPAKDLVVSIFNILKETPITAFGINHLVHYKMSNIKEYIEIGDKLAPFSNWRGSLKEPRLNGIEILDTKRSDKYQGHYQIKIGPSPEFSTGPSKYFILVNINDHYDIIKGNFKLNSSLDGQWELSLTKADEILNGLWQQLAL